MCLRPWAGTRLARWGQGSRDDTCPRAAALCSLLFVAVPRRLAVDGSRGVERGQRTATVGAARATRETLGSGRSLSGAGPLPPFGFLSPCALFSAFLPLASLRSQNVPFTASLVRAVKRPLKEKKALS